MSKYAIWDKTSPVITPVGEVFSAEQWIQRYPVAGIETITVVCAGGEINGGFFGTLGEMVRRAEAEGCDFSECVTNEQKLEKIEAFEIAMAAETRAKAQEAAEAEAQNATITADSLASIAASMEYQNMMTLEDVEV